MRYGRKFRIFSGILAFTAGILNYGIFPAVTARFLVYFCGMPEAVSIFGLSVGTYPLTMIGVLAFALFILFNGGQVSIMVTGFLQGSMIFMSFAVILLIVLFRFGLNGIFEPLLDAPAGASLLNPFDQSTVSDFNIWFFVMLTFNRMYSWLVWPSVQGYMAAAKSPHEAKMSRVLGQWSYQTKQAVMITLPLVAWVVLNHSGLYPEESAAATEAINALGNPDLQKELTVPLTLIQILPPGAIGLFAAVMLGAAVTTDNSFIHSWGGIFIQDVVAPIYGKPISQKQHIRLLKAAIFGVTAFAFFWSMIFPLKQWIFMYFQITSSLYLSGAGIALIGALYWKRGTVQGAWGAIITGLILTVIGILLRQCWEMIPGALNVATEFPINGVFVFTISAVCSTGVYVAISLLTYKQEFDLDKLLHRGQFAVEQRTGMAAVGHRKTFKEILGITNEFSRFDLIVYVAGYLWIFFFIFLNLGLTAWHFFVCELSSRFWMELWKIYLVLIGAIGIVAAIWFTIGGFVDLKALSRTLRQERPDEHDDGFVK